MAATAVAAAVWLLVSHLMGAPESKANQEKSVRWPFGLGAVTDVPARFPPSKIDATAQRVNAIARQLRASGRALRPSIQSYLSRQIGRSNDQVDAPPDDIRRFLDGHAAAIDQLRRVLASGAPRWAVGIEHHDPERSVDISEQGWLFRVIAVDAFDHHSRGDDATGWRDAETGWVLAQGLWAQPDLFTRLVALSGTGMMNAVAAKLSTPAPAWQGQLLAFDADRAVAEAMQFAAWRAMTSPNRLRESPDRDDSQIWRRSIGMIVQTIGEQRASNYAASLRAGAEKIASWPFCTDAPANRSSIGVGEAIGSRLKRFHIEREATAKLLALKEQRRRSGEWPEAVPGIGISICGADSWRYRRDADGSMSLSFVKPAQEDVRAPSRLPLSFRYPK